MEARKNETVRVHFVGAGPGAVDLITVRGMKLLEAADVVVYAGSLVNPELLAICKNATCYNSAKMTLEEVIQVIVDAYEKGATIVRLHTGEPSIYGAIKEQMDLLAEKGIAFDSCPGVSACFGAAASLNLEFTLPNVSQSLIITRVEGKTSMPPLEQIELFASHQASMAIYLSAMQLDKLKEKLILGGYLPSTPAAIVYKATWPEEEKYICTVETLPAIAKEHKITKTAVILVGDVIGCADYNLSRLYAADFSTEFRKAKK